MGGVVGGGGGGPYWVVAIEALGWDVGVAVLDGGVFSYGDGARRPFLRHCGGVCVLCCAQWQRGVVVVRCKVINLVESAMGQPQSAPPQP